jgi:hypothetical protein
MGYELLLQLCHDIWIQFSGHSYFSLDILESKGSKIGVSVLSSNFQGPLGKVLWAITHFTIPFRTCKVKEVHDSNKGNRVKLKGC